MPKFCIKKLPTGERVHKRYHYHDRRCAPCWHVKEDDDHIFQCDERRGLRKKVIKQKINLLENTVDPGLCDMLKEGLMSYFNGESAKD